MLALALALAAGRLAAGWQGALADTATLQIFAPEAAMEEQARAALNVLRTTPGVRSVRMIDVAEQERLLEPWLGPDVAADSLPLPLMIEVATDRARLNVAGLEVRLAAEAPGAVFDDHAAWRQPLVAAAVRLRLFALGCLGLLGLALAGVLGLAARAAVAANGQVIRTLRLVGARDGYIARAFTRRPTRQAAAGALVGTALGTALLAALPRASEQGFFLVGIGLVGWHWLAPLAIPPAAAAIAWLAARRATRRGLGAGADVLLLRSLVFDALLYALMAVMGVLCAPLAIWSVDGAYWVVKTYCRLAFAMLRGICGLRVEIRGPVPTGEVIVCAKHQSFLDIMMLAHALPRPKFVMKKELRWAPILGLYALRIGSTPVARGARSKAMQDMVAHAGQRAREPRQLVIYPQGTRVMPGARRPFKIGAGVLYERLGDPCVPAATNTGVFWARRSPYRRPGTAVVEFFEPIEPGLPVPAFMARIEAVIETNSDRLMREAGFRFPDDRSGPPATGDPRYSGLPER